MQGTGPVWTFPDRTGTTCQRLLHTEMNAVPGHRSLAEAYPSRWSHVSRYPYGAVQPAENSL